MSNYSQKQTWTQIVAEATCHPQMQAYMVNASYTIVDTGPGSGPLLMNIVMSSHGFILPVGIDQKAASCFISMARSIAHWTDAQDLTSHVRIRNVVNPDVVSRQTGEVLQTNRYPLPLHVPKFLGAVYSRLGNRGHVYPYNQYIAMIQANAKLNQTLMPILLERGMLLDDLLYQQALQDIPLVSTSDGSSSG
jgi:cellulose biosynthesis protein BcsQ